MNLISYAKLISSTHRFSIEIQQRVIIIPNSATPKKDIINLYFEYLFQI